jgi:hypothetical protein
MRNKFCNNVPLMFRSRSLLGALILMSLATTPLPATAHHAFAAEFDRAQPIEITGTVSKVEWMNPHARIYVDVTDGNGKTVNWNLEMGSPNGLMRRGWRRDSLKPGDVVTITGWRARNNPLVGNIDDVIMPDGSKIFADTSANN